GCRRVGCAAGRQEERESDGPREEAVLRTRRTHGSSLPRCEAPISAPRLCLKLYPSAGLQRISNKLKNRWSASGLSATLLRAGAHQPGLSRRGGPPSVRLGWAC